MKKILIFLSIIMVLLFTISCEEDKPTEQETTPPEVVITFPANNSEIIIGSEIEIIADANDSGGISKVEFYINGNKENTDYSTPYKYEWNVLGVAGAVSIYAKAYDESV